MIESDKVSIQNIPRICNLVYVVITMLLYDMFGSSIWFGYVGATKL